MRGPRISKLIPSETQTYWIDGLMVRRVTPTLWDLQLLNQSTSINWTLLTLTYLATGSYQAIINMAGAYISGTTGSIIFRTRMPSGSDQTIFAMSINQNIPYHHICATIEVNTNNQIEYQIGQAGNIVANFYISTLGYTLKIPEYHKHNI